MKFRLAMTFARACLAGLLHLSAVALSEPSGTPVGRPDAAAPDKAVEASQGELLGVAFSAASAMPVMPHLKNRSRAQYDVVSACLKLGQVSTALKYADEIGNWRRGLAYADIAFHFAMQEKAGTVEQLLDRAQEISQLSEDWRRDRIRVRIAQTRVLLGETVSAEALAMGEESPERGKLAQAEAMLVDDASFAQQLSQLQAQVEKGGFDLVKNTLKAYTALYGRIYSDPEKRAAIEAEVRQSWTTMPIFVRIEILTQLADVAIEEKDFDAALAFADDALEMLEGANWPVEHRIRLTSGLVKLRARAGDKETAPELAASMLALFQREGGSMVDVFRARALRPLAEAYNLLGDKAKAAQVYTLALTEGAGNPNSRPRAVDLCATCCSMAIYGFEPTPPMWRQIKDVRQSLGDPW